jgi:hypothetical protein
MQAAFWWPMLFLVLFCNRVCVLRAKLRCTAHPQRVSLLMGSGARSRAVRRNWLGREVVSGWGWLCGHADRGRRLVGDDAGDGRHCGTITRDRFALISRSLFALAWPHRAGLAHAL